MANREELIPELKSWCRGEGLDEAHGLMVDMAPATDEDFNSKLKALIQAEGRTMEDIKAPLPTVQPSTNSTESILQAVGDFLQKTNKSPSTTHLLRNTACSSRGGAVSLLA